MAEENLIKKYFGAKSSQEQSNKIECIPMQQEKRVAVMGSMYVPEALSNIAGGDPEGLYAPHSYSLAQSEMILYEGQRIQQFMWQIKALGPEEEVRFDSRIQFDEHGQQRMYLYEEGFGKEIPSHIYASRAALASFPLDIELASKSYTEIDAFIDKHIGACNKGIVYMIVPAMSQIDAHAFVVPCTLDFAQRYRAMTELAKATVPHLVDSVSKKAPDVLAITFTGEALKSFYGDAEKSNLYSQIGDAVQNNRAFFITEAAAAQAGFCFDIKDGLVDKRFQSGQLGITYAVAMAGADALLSGTYAKLAGPLLSPDHLLNGLYEAFEKTCAVRPINTRSEIAKEAEAHRREAIDAVVGGGMNIVRMIEPVENTEQTQHNNGSEKPRSPAPRM